MEQITFNKIKFRDIDTKLRVLDDFCNFYGWGIYTIDNKLYLIYDLQTNEIVDNNVYWKDSLINRVSSRALDYEINEHDSEDYIIDKETYNYYIKLFVIYVLYGNLEENKNWYLDIKNTFKKFIIG